MLDLAKSVISRRDGGPRRQGPADHDGDFTAEARKEANRDGATPVELIDGDKLCDLLKRYELGVRTKERVEEDVDATASKLVVISGGT